MTDDWMDRSEGRLDRFGKWMDKREMAQSWKNPSWWYLLIVLPGVLLAVLNIHQWNVDRRIAAREMTAVGIITIHEPAQHNRYGYTFSVGGRTYSGWETPSRAETVIGQKVRVYYDPVNPEESALTDYAESSTGSLAALPLVLGGVLAVAVIVFVRRRQFAKEACQTIQ